jgi:membrane protein implicated in regulation of membrane protease activity
MKWILTLFGAVMLAPLVAPLIGCIFALGCLCLYALWSCAGEILAWSGVALVLAIVVKVWEEHEKQRKKRELQRLCNERR